ncbi:MAG TPA: hypothetical protein VMV28_04875 [Thermoplasmata archaeon]|nr:hypothetical protein [Thermoplasmata archaeon]
MPLLGTGEVIHRKFPAVSGDGRHGELFLTTYRLIFEGPKTGGILHRHEVSTILSVMLVDLHNVTTAKPFIGPPVLRIETAAGSATFRVQQAALWHSDIVKARADAFAEPTVAHKAGESVTHETHTVERQVVKVRCRYCGNLTDEVAGKCASCGAKL